MGIVVLAIVLAIIGVLVGWLAPMVVKSRRPYGMGGDITRLRAHHGRSRGHRMAVDHATLQLPRVA